MESGPQYIYILQSFVFSRENYVIFCIVCTFICYITCIAHTFHINGRMVGVLSLTHIPIDIYNSTPTYTGIRAQGSTFFSFMHHVYI